METTLTTEAMATFYNRAIAFSDTKFCNGKPNRIEIYEDGTLCAVWRGYDKYDDDTEEIFFAEEITIDLDVIAKQREERLKAEKIAAEKHQKEINIKYAKEQKEKRLIQYNNLKKEFEK